MDQIKQITDKYLLSSLLQKSIRLGITKAADNTIETLFKIDKNYLMYRMMIIAFEDIGAANMELMKKITQYRWGVRNFKERNVDFLSYFKALGQELCDSSKDRTACDATYLLQKAYLYGDMDAVLENKTLQDIWSGWQILGFKRYAFDSNAHATDTPDDIEGFIAHTQNKTQKDSRYLEQFYNTQVDSFFLSTPYLAQGVEKVIAQEGAIEDLALNSKPTDFVWSAIDGHTRIGSTSIQQLLKNNYQQFNSILRLDSQEAMYKVVKMLLFRVEGQNIEHKVLYPEGQAIKQLTQQKECQYYFPQLHWTQYMQAVILLNQLLPELNTLRQKQLNNMLTYEAEQLKNVSPIIDKTTKSLKTSKK